MAKTQERVTLGKSILVPSVKEIAEKQLVNVPDRYVRCDQFDSNNIDNDNDNDGKGCCLMDVQLPIIDMQGLLCGDEMELQRLHSACKDWGFFQLVNHGVSTSLIEKFKKETQAFFNLSSEEKKKYWQTSTDVEGYGQAFVLSEEQKLDWADMFYITILPKHQRRPNLLPKLPLSYRETLEDYSSEMQKLATKITECMAKALNVEVQVMRDIFGEDSQSMRMNYYPPCPQPEKVIGLNSHSDAISFITILLQVNQVEGLQIRKDDRWISIKPVPDAFTVNIGDIFEIVSNGIYQSILHRAVVNSSKERLSVATFCSPALDREIGPIPSLISTDNPAKFRRISMVDYWKGFLLRVLDEKSYLDGRRISGN